MSAESPLGVGLIGTGLFATQRHYPAIASIPTTVQFAACANRSIDKAKKFASLAGISDSKVYDSLASLLSDPQVDFIDALLPAQFTVQAVKDAISAGKPIAIEKPIAATLAQAKEVVALARSTELPVAVLENFVFWNVIPEIKALLGQIGTVVYFSHYCTSPFNFNNQYLDTWWRKKPEHVGGFLSDGGVHQVALFTEVLGEIDTLSALTTQVREQSGDVDTLTATLKMKSGVLGSFTYTSAVSHPRINKLSINGTTGTIIYDFSDKAKATLTLYTDADKVGKIIPVPDNVQEGVPKEFENFAEAVIKKDKSLLKIPTEKAFHHFAVIVASVESSNNGGTLVKVAEP
ncbi:hypothetical protein V1525DRAFT_412952 [Lipomyces kononenkoae]|uniref:Uncharacterized protein n=1 Tax=Lipomyces kononenkoae TaxID=34357 RepID=A0ACC3SS89_LIPKO